MLESLTKKFRPEKGQVVVFTVLLLPLILGVVVLVIEIGNVYVQYQELQNVADTAALTGTAENARKVAEANSKNFSNKSDFAIKTYTGARKVPTTPADTNFYVKLEKNMPPFFLKVFDKITTLKAYAVVSDEGKLVSHNADLEKDFNWTIVPAPEPEEP